MANGSREIVAVFLLVWTFATQCSAQQTVSLSKQAAVIKEKADHLSLQAHISVARFHAGEVYGNFLSNDQASLTFYDVDRKTDVTIPYDEVRRIKLGYGGYNSLQGRHTNSTRKLIVVAAITGTLVGLIVAVALTKD